MARIVPLVDGTDPAAEGLSLPMYDRSVFIAAAHSVGDRTPSDVARRLKVARSTAHRLWHGDTEPGAHIIAGVQQEYGLSAMHLLKQKTAA